MTTALLVGGDHDGHVIDQVPPGRPGVVMATAGLGSLLSREELSREVPTTFYAFRRLALFGRTITVGVAPGLTSDDLDRLAIQHLLTPLARNLLDVE